MSNQRTEDPLAAAIRLGNKAAHKRWPKSTQPKHSDEWWEYAEGWTAGYLAGRKAERRKRK